MMNLEQKSGVATTTHGVLTHHLNSFGVGDIVGTMADYTAESKFFTSEGLLRGPEAIRSFFVKLFEEFAKPRTSFEILRQEVDGATAYIVWRPETADYRFDLGTDTVIVQPGNIRTQTV